MLKYQKTEWADIFRKIKSKGGHTDEDKKETDISAGTDRGTEEEAVEYINEENFDGLKAMAVEDMASIMNKERMDEAKARISEDWGKFKSISDITAGEITQRGVTAAVVYVTAEYENTDIRYTFAFDEDMKLASLGMQ